MRGRGSLLGQGGLPEGINDVLRGITRLEMTWKRSRNSQYVLEVDKKTCPISYIFILNIKIPNKSSRLFVVRQKWLKLPISETSETVVCKLIN